MIKGESNCVRDCIHVFDIAATHILAVKNLQKRPFDVYNLGSGIGYTVREVVDKIALVTGGTIRICGQAAR